MNANALTMDRSPLTSFIIEKHDEDNSDYKVDDLSFSIVDDTIFDGDTCTDYAKYDSNYEDCLVKHYREELSTTYGCQHFPPWIEGHCTSSGETNKEYKDTSLLDKVWRDIDKLTDGLPIEVMKKCKQPCKR